MARYRDSVCRICRREGLKLFLKGDRCYTDKCSIDRRAYPPGQHGQGRKKTTEYGVQLREKQKVRRMYGLLEKQFRNYFKIAARQKGATGDNLLVLIESRLDNMVYRFGFANSRNEARQMVSHGHFLVDGKKANVPSMRLKVGSMIEVREKSLKHGKISDALDAVVRRGVPEWLELDRDKFKGTVKALPSREDITMPIQENLIVELYSK
ncbi:MAG: 30S ribosomal protein S4 [Proteobacteria bacterium]|nr:30S ribosomal protein S4 [Pseudomonadota bacterium]